MPDDRQELSDRSGGQDVPPERPAQHVVVAQDREQRPERRRGQPQVPPARTRRRSRRAPAAGHQDRRPLPDEPSSDGQPSRPLAEQVELELVARQEEQEAEADVATSTMASARASQDLGADQHPPTIRMTTWGTRKRDSRPAHDGAAAEVIDTTSSACRPVSSNTYRCPAGTSFRYCSTRHGSAHTALSSRRRRSPAARRTRPPDDSSRVHAVVQPFEPVDEVCSPCGEIVRARHRQHMERAEDVVRLDAA